MKNQTSGSEVIHKEVVIIGNGPSGLSLSAMLSGLSPYVTTHSHPDEMLSARLAYNNVASNTRSLFQQQALLAQLATGLEGRTTNPVSLLLDALEHPYADLGMEMPSLIQWRRNEECQIDHVVLGKGPPGGSWHTMDPNVLTLSLGSWMALPGLPYIPDPNDTSDSQRRASAGAVARYYQLYVQKLHLEEYFQCGINVYDVEPIQQTPIRKKSKCDTEIQIPRRKCSFVNALNYIKSRTKCHKQKRPRDNRKVREIIMDQNLYCSRICLENEENSLPEDFYSTKSKNKYRSVKSLNEEEISLRNSFCDSTNTIYYEPNKKRSLSFSYGTDNCDNKKLEEDMEILCECSDENNDIPSTARWLVRAVNSSGSTITYSCNNLVLANGASDLPNRLGLSAETYDLPWVLHDLRRLEDKLDEFVKEMGENPDPVLVVGAGLSAADAVIATRFRSIPVLHVFRHRSVSLDKQLPENMYPEYHKVHQMMLDGGSTYSYYTALPEYTISDISSDKTVTIVSRTGVPSRHKVSFAVILIGSRPNLTFLPNEWSLGVNKTLPVDAKTNPIDINVLTHAVNGYEGLYAVGPLAGDNFVRFIPGGALAVVSDLYTKKNW